MTSSIALTAVLNLTGLSAAQPVPVPVDTTLQQSWMNNDLTAWSDKQILYHRLAQALGIENVADARFVEYPAQSRAVAEYSSGLNFYLSDPHKTIQPNMNFELSENELNAALASYPYTFSRYPQLARAIDESELVEMSENNPELFEKVKASFERTKAWSHPNRPFPHNLAMLQSWGNSDRWEPCPDFQQQQVIEDHVAAIVAYTKATEDNDFDYRFTGVIGDVVEIWLEFNWNSTRGLPGHPETERFARHHGDITHDYATLREGWYVYLGHLRDELEKAFPGRPIYFIWEPTPIVSTWVEPLRTAPYATLTPELREKIRGDALVDEKPGLQYLIDPDLDGPDGWPLHRRGSATSDLFSKGPHYPTHLVYFGEISSRGGYLFSYGSGIDRTRAPVYTFENQFKLFRVFSAWQNQLGTPVEMRTWDAEQEIYASPTAYADAHGLAGVHHQNRKLYAVLVDEHAAIHLADGARLTRLQSANTYWEPESVPDAELQGGVLRPKPDARFPVSVIADVELTTPNQAVLTTAPGVALQQDRAQVVIPNREVLNPDFEDGLEGWSGSGAAVAQIVERPAASGKHAVRVYNREKPWNGLDQPIQGVLMNHRQGRYRVRAQVRTDQGPGAFTLKIRVFENEKSTDFTTTPVEVRPGGWVTIDEVLELDWEDFVTRANLYIERRSDTREYFVDDVLIEFLGKPSQ